MLRRRALLTWVTAISIIAVLAVPATALALTQRQGDTVTIASGEVISDDLYVFGNTITIDGTVDGDLVAFGQVVVIGGEVRGSVITAAQTIRIGGTVDGTVRAAGATVDVGGTVDGDVLIAANQANISGAVIRDVAVGAQTASINGTVGRNLMVGSTSLSIAGKVGGDVQAQSTRVTITNTGVVAGNLDYWSATRADVLGSVSGVTSQHEPTTEQAATGGTGVARTILAAVVAWMQSYVAFVALGLILVFGLREPMERGSRAVLDRMGASLGAGALAFFATPMAIGFLFIAGLFVGAWWLSFVLIMVYALLMLAGVVVGSLAVGRAILHRMVPATEPALAWSLLLGLLVVWFVGALPIVGWLAGWIVTMSGAGALVLLLIGKAERPTPVAAVGQAPAPQPVAPQFTQPSH